MVKVAYFGPKSTLKEVKTMVNEVGIVQNMGNLAIYRGVSSFPRHPQEMTVDYGKEFPLNKTWRFLLSWPADFQFRISEPVEIYVNPDHTDRNELYRITRTLVNDTFLSLSVEAYLSDDWCVRLAKLDSEHRALEIAVNLPKRCAFSVQSLSAGRCFIVGRGDDEDFFLTDDMRTLAEHGIDPF